MNELLLNEETEITQETPEIKKYINYINKYSENIKNSNDLEILEYLKSISKFSSNDVYKKQGDEIMENLWKLYRCETKLLSNFPNKLMSKSKSSQDQFFDINNNPEYFLNLILMNEKLTEKVLKENLMSFDKKKKVLKINFQVTDFESILDIKNNNNFSNKILINNILDLIFLKILCEGNIKTFYTVLSSMFMLTEGKTILIMKIISYFAICIWKFENKESFVGSLLYIVGGMLRDYSKSYLKTKGILKMSLIDHKCNHQVKYLF